MRGVICIGTIYFRSCLISVRDCKNCYGYQMTNTWRDSTKQLREKMSEQTGEEKQQLNASARQSKTIFHVDSLVFEELCVNPWNKRVRGNERRIFELLERGYRDSVIYSVCTWSHTYHTDHVSFFNKILSSARLWKVEKSRFKKRKTKK